MVDIIDIELPDIRGILSGIRDEVETYIDDTFSEVSETFKNKQNIIIVRIVTESKNFLLKMSTDHGHRLPEAALTKISEGVAAIDAWLNTNFPDIEADLEKWDELTDLKDWIKDEIRSLWSRN